MRVMAIGVCVQNRGTARPTARPAGWAARLAGVLAVLALLPACSSTGDNPMTMFADPGKYEFYNCEQITAQRKHWSGREQELRQLMDRAQQNAGGAVVNLLAYKADHVAAREELVVLENTARSKKCDTPATWRSNSVVR
jgi:hypothetical protein